MYQPGMPLMRHIAIVPIKIITAETANRAAKPTIARCAFPEKENILQTAIAMKMFMDVRIKRNMRVLEKDLMNSKTERPRDMEI